MSAERSKRVAISSEVASGLSPIATSDVRANSTSSGTFSSSIVPAAMIVARSSSAWSCWEVVS